jgi:HlyD family secretion protein
MKTTLKIVLTLFTLSGINCSNNQDPNTLSASGTIETIDVTVSTKLGGEILELEVKEGDKVRSGDLLIVIDHELLDIQLRQAEAGVDLAYSQLRLLESGARKEDIRQSEDLLKQAKVNLDQAVTDRDRMQALYESNTVTKKQFEEALNRYELTLAQYNSAKDNLSKVKSIIRPEEIQGAKANLRKAIATVDQLKQNISDCSIHSPSDGFISKKYVESGEIVAPSSSLLKVSNLETVNLVIYVSEVELGKVKLGQTAEIKVDAFEEKTYTGKIIFISPEAEFTPKNIQTQDERTKLVFGVKIEIPNPQFELKPGMPADAKVILN